MDALDLTAALADSWISLRLWSANTIEGPYTYAGIEQTLVAGTYSYTFVYGAGNRAMYYKLLFWSGAVYSPLAEAPPIHGGGGLTLATIRRKLGSLTGDLEYGTTTAAGTTTTAKCTTIDFARMGDDFFNSYVFHNVDNSEAALVTDWAQATGTFTFTPALTAVSSGVGFEVYKRWTPKQYREAINWAVGAAFPTLSRPIVNTGLRTADNVMTYDIPHDIRVLTRVEIEDVLQEPTSTNRHIKGQPWREMPFGTIQDGLAHELEFKRQPPFESAVRRMRLRGTGTLSQVYNDTDYIEVVEPQLDLILYLAAHYLYARHIPQSASSDRDFYQEQAAYWLSEYEKYKGVWGSKRPAKKLWGHDSRWQNGRTGLSWR